MSPERWRRIEKLFHATLARAAEERGPFLVEASSGDEALRLEVESLLASHESTKDTTGAIAAAVAAEMLAEGRPKATVGSDLGHYRLLSLLGAGGMGEVYRARDTTLGREVALKILPVEATRDPGRVSRFEQEARAASALNHPNILTIFEIGRADDNHYMATELVEGETLRERLAVGRFDLRAALDVGAQAAGALAAAHAAGIVHRDIKPENIMSRRDGYVKILDFGVAKLTARPASALSRELPRLDEVKTDVGTVIGTVGYMSPEQVRGIEVDGRTDLFSLGVVLYEMVTGARAFPGESANDVIASILKSEPPPLRHHLPEVPAELERIVSKALAKDREERYQGAKDLQIDLKNLRHEGEVESSVRRSLPTESRRGRASHALPPGEEAAEAATERIPAPNWKIAASFAVGAAILVALLTFALRFRPGTEPAEQPLRKFPITVEGASWGTAHDDLLGPVISPDGRHIAYTVGFGAQRRIWVHDLDQVSARELPGTEAARSLFWSPDSQFIGFGTFPSVNPALKKVSVRGGVPSVLCSLNGRELLGATWTPRGTIIFMPFQAFGGLYEVSADGGEKKPFTQVDAKGGEWSHRTPFLLPDGRSLLINNLRLDNRRGIVVLGPNGERRDLGEGRLPVFSPSGHIVYESKGNLVAMPFSLSTLSPAGEPSVIASNATRPSVAADGTLVYQIQGVSSDQLVWVDRGGTVVGRIGQPQDDIRFVTLFRDGRRVAVRGTERDADDVWIHDGKTGQKIRLTFDSATEAFPVPSPSGEETIFSRLSLGKILKKRSDGSGEEIELLKGFRITPNDWSPDGRYLLGSVEGNETGVDLWYMPLEGAQEPVPFLKTPTIEAAGRFSPDGRFVAYTSDETGQFEVYVKPFPSGDGKWQVSSRGGRQPHWSRASGELFYLEGEEMMVAKVSTTPVFSFQASQKLFTVVGMRTATTVLWPSMFDVAADGQRFAMVQTTGAPANRMVVVQGLFSGIRSRTTRGDE